MRYHLKCKCGAQCFVRGEDDPDTNSTDYDLDDAEWEGGSADCLHEEFECVGADSDEPTTES